MVTRGLDDFLISELREAAESVGCELLHVKYHGKMLQIFLDREDGGVTLDHCQTVSRMASAILDVHDFGKQKYILEVSSPGLDRELYSERDYRRFEGSLGRVTYLDSEQRKTTVVGRLGTVEGSDADAVLDLIDPDSGETLRIPLERVQLARLEVEL